MEQFATTHWSAVLTAAGAPATDAARALESLCAAYWTPVYAYIRRRGVSAEDARDFTQEFFLRFIEKSYLKDVDPAKGKFRSFLLASVRHFLSNEWDRARAQKRGGQVLVFSLDVTQAEARHRDAVSHTLDPEACFERAWALALLDTVLTRLRAEHAASGKERQFEVLKDTLARGESSLSYRALGDALGTTEGAIKVAVLRLRRRYRDLLIDEVRQTLADGESVEEELRYLMEALR